ncbi:MAG: DUF2125 domain-containing protein [Acetobacteraceae bacterium]|nr:DUF2125 domain-containing protein [Acetobacteraceae bacterium]
MRRRRKMALAAIPLVLVLAHFAYWRQLQHQLADGYAQWVAQAQAAGWTVQAGPAVGGGWPLDARLAIRDVALSGGKASVPGGIAWRSPAVTLRIGLIDPLRLEIDAQGQQAVRFGDSPDIPVAADRLHATLTLGRNGTPQAVDILINRMTADIAPARGEAGRTSIGLLQAHADLVGGPSGTGVTLSAEAIDLPAMVKWPLGSRLSSLALEGTVSGVLGGGASQSESAAAWRDSGGSVEIRRFAVGWGPLGVSATATLALDDQLQPMGAGTAKLVGYDAALDALAANGSLSRSAVTAAKAVLSLLAPTPGDGEPSAVDVPLTLQYRTLSMRQVPLLRLPELDWPQR